MCLLFVTLIKESDNVYTVFLGKGHIEIIQKSKNPS